MRTVLVIIVAALGLPGGWPLQPRSAQVARREAGFVVRVEGRWEVLRSDSSRPEPAVVPMTLRDGDTLRRAGATSGGSITVAYYNGETTRHTAAVTIIEASDEPPGRLEMIMRLIRSRFSEGIVTAAVRGGDTLHNAVVRHSSEATALDAVVADLPAGAYRASLTLLDAGGSPASSAQSFSISVRGGRARGPALDSGLYELRVTGASAPVPGRAWIRVLPVGADEQPAADLALLGSKPAVDGATRAIVDALERTYLLLANGQPGTRP